MTESPLLEGVTMAEAIRMTDQQQMPDSQSPLPETYRVVYFAETGHFMRHGWHVVGPDSYVSERMITRWGAKVRAWRLNRLLAQGWICND